MEESKDKTVREVYSLNVEDLRAAMNAPSPLRWAVDSCINNKRSSTFDI